MNKHYDIVIVGGAVTGSSVAYFLTNVLDFQGSVAIIERDPTFAKAATSLSASSIRHQFSNSVNVQIGQFGSQFLREFTEEYASMEDFNDLNFEENGYLFLAETDEQAQILRENHDVQISCGADVVLWDADELEQSFPHLNVSNLQLASYGRSGEGWFSNTGLMNNFRVLARNRGAHYVIGEVVGVERDRNTIVGVKLGNGHRINCSVLVNAAGTRSPTIAALAGLSIPVEPRKRSIFVFHCSNSPQGSAAVNHGRLPLMIDSSGIFCRPEGSCFMTGRTPESDLPVEPDDFEPRYEEFETIWMRLAYRSKYFEAIKLVNSWAGHYDYNSFDQNAIIGPHSEVGNFIFASGFTGHGLQQSPAVGRAIAELITFGNYQTLDLSELGHDRIMRGRPLLERAVI